MQVSPLMEKSTGKLNVLQKKIAAKKEPMQKAGAN